LTSLAVLVVLAGPLLAAPVPTDKPPPSIDGKYTLLSVSTPNDRVGPGGGFPAGGPGGFGRASVTSTLLLRRATLPKHESLLQGGRLCGAAPAMLAALGAAGGSTTMEYTLDATKSPMTIDVETTSLRGKKSKSLGVVEVVGNRLIIAVAKEGDERPKTTE